MRKKIKNNSGQQPRPKYWLRTTEGYYIHKVGIDYVSYVHKKDREHALQFPEYSVDYWMDALIIHEPIGSSWVKVDCSTGQEVERIYNCRTCGLPLPDGCQGKYRGEQGCCLTED